MQKMSRLYIQRYAKLNFNPNPLVAVLGFMSMLLTANIYNTQVVSVGIWKSSCTVIIRMWIKYSVHVLHLELRRIKSSKFQNLVSSVRVGGVVTRLYPLLLYVCISFFLYCWQHLSFLLFSLGVRLNSQQSRWNDLLSVYNIFQRL